MGPCDFCKSYPAPFGYAPPPAMRIEIRRPLRTCADPSCREKAEGRRQALIERHDPLAARRRQRAEDPAPKPVRPPAQRSLL